MPHGAPQRRGTAVALAVAMTASLGLAACSSEESGPPTLTWFINPDGGGSDPTKGGQVQIAKECSDASGGRYKIKAEQLPNSASDQRQQLLRRLAAGDKGVDIMSIDPVFVAEFAEADYLAPVPAALKDDFTQDRVESALKSSTWKGQLVAVPFWANTQVLWYRKSVAQAAGLDMTKPVTWDQVIKAASGSKKTVGVQSALYEGYTVWINALVAGAGGTIVTNPGATADETKLSLDSPAGQTAGKIIQSLAKSGAGGPAMGSSQESQALDLFKSPSSGFLVNWPYVYAALKGEKTPWLSDLGWTKYPQSVAGQESKPPFGGIELGVAKSSKHKDLAYDAVKCITTAAHQASYMVATGNPASRKAVFDDPKVKAEFPMAALLRESLSTAAPRPASQLYGDITTGLQQKFSPPGSVNENSAAKAQKFILDVLKGEALL